jgi:hypothetical protein
MFYFVRDETTKKYIVSRSTDKKAVSCKYVELRESGLDCLMMEKVNGRISRYFSVEDAKAFFGATEMTDAELRRDQHENTYTMNLKTGEMVRL